MFKFVVLAVLAATASAQYAYNGLGYAGAAPLGYAGAAYAGAPLGYAGAGLGYAAAPLGYAGAYAPAYAGAYAQAAPLAYAGAYAPAAPLAVAPAHAAYALPPVQEIQEAPLVSQTVEAVEQHGYSVRY